MFGKLNYYIFLFVGFSLSLVVPNVHSIGIIALVVSWILTLPFPNQKLIKNKLFLLFVSMYSVILIGELISTNTAFAISFIETSTILIAIPLVLFGSKREFDKKMLVSTITSFIVGVISLNLISLFFISYDLWDTKNLQSNLIIANNLIVKIHPTFLSMYISFSAIFLVDMYFPLKKLTRIQLGWVVFSLSVLIVFLIWLNSRAGILAFLCATIFFIGFKWRGKTRIVGFSGLFLFLVLIIILPFSKYRFLETPIAVLKGETVSITSDPNVYPLMTRLEILQCNVELLKWPEILYGYGTGDFRDELQKCFAVNNFQRPLAENMDSHSEYFAQLHRHGIIGFTIFLALLIVPFRHALKNKSPLLGAFIILFAVTALFENVFSAQKSVTFFALFCPLLWMLAKQEHVAKESPPPKA